MASLSIQVPYPVFYDRDGQPLDNGNIYIGVANLDPVTNPIAVYFDEALTLPASQPLKTSNGYVYRNGTPTQLYVDAVNFSILVNDNNNSLVYSFPKGTGTDPSASVFGKVTIQGNDANIFQIKRSDNVSMLNVNDVIPYNSAVGTRTTAAPRITGGNKTDINFDSFITSNCIASGSVLYRDEFQDTSSFTSTGGDGAHASFDAFCEFTGSTALNHSRGFQSRGKISMSGTSLLSEYTCFISLPIFNGTFNIGQTTAFWVRDAQIDSGTQNLFTSYGLLIDNCPNRGNNFTPIASFSNKASYIGGNMQFANTADVFGAREVRANAVHASGGIATFVSSGGVLMYYTGGQGFIRSYSDAGGTGDKLTINPAGGQVVVGGGAGGNAGTVMDVTGLMSATGYFVGANQVVGARQPAVADATGAGDVVAQLNALLARLRTHGLIAT